MDLQINLSPFFGAIPAPGSAAGVVPASLSTRRSAGTSLGAFQYGTRRPASSIVPDMSLVPDDYDAQVKAAIANYWKTLGTQAKKQGAGNADRGNRSAVTGGKQMDGFSKLVKSVASFNGMPDASIFVRGGLELPGFFRATKKWDLIVVHDKNLVAAVEFKSHVGPSFGNNFNNRTEEALGTALDFSTALSEGAFGVNKPRPWAGWVMCLEDCKGSSKPLKVNERHFKVFKEFRDASYAKRYELLLTRLLLTKHYDGAALILCTREGGEEGNYSEPAANLGIKRFLTGLGGHIQTFLATE